MSPRTWRRYALFGALAVVLVLSAVSGKGWNNEGEASAAPPPPRPPQVSRAPVQALPAIELERLGRRDASLEGDKMAGNAFGAMTWHVPPPPPKPMAQPAPPPAPTAPPMPFAFLGRYEDGGTRTILLVKGERIYMVSEGDVIEQTYRVEKLAGSELELTYLPLGIKQTINAGGS